MPSNPAAKPNGAEHVRRSRSLAYGRASRRDEWMSADRRSASAGPPSGLRSGSLWQLSLRHFPPTTPMPMSATSLPAAPRSPPRGDLIRVASVPAGHVYVRHLADPDGADRVVRLPDVRRPTASRCPAAGGRRRCSIPSGCGDHATSSTSCTSTSASTPSRRSDLRELARRSDAAGKPAGAHRARPAQPAPPRRRAARRAARACWSRPRTAIITLTAGRARRSPRRWGREATVLPHPHVVDPPRARGAARRSAATAFVVGLHAKSLRANMDPARRRCACSSRRSRRCPAHGCASTCTPTS